MHDVRALLKVEADKRATPKAEWSGFPLWHALRVEPGRELRAADFLIDRAGALIYFPLYYTQERLRGRRHATRPHAVVPGLLFAPDEIVDLPRRDFAFTLAHVHGFLLTTGKPTIIAEAEIIRLRTLEAANNLAPVLSSAAPPRVGATVRLRNPLYQSWGQGRVVRIDGIGRIDVEFARLFGRLTKITVPAAECEWMQPSDGRIAAPRSKPSTAA